MVKSLHFKVLHSASAGNLVFNERVDVFDMDNGKTISLPVAGVFEVSGNKISAWRDYFDPAMYTKQMQ
jgi:limonene-1,2-epoxide hydrolase